MKSSTEVERGHTVQPSCDTLKTEKKNILLRDSKEGKHTKSETLAEYPEGPYTEKASFLSIACLCWVCSLK